MSAKAAARAVAPRLYLAIPAALATSRLSEMGGALSQADVAAVLLRLPTSDPRSLTERVKAFAALVQSTGAALVIDAHADLVARGGADGAHLTGMAAVRDHRPTLQPQRIAGAGGLATRHDAMLAGEAGVDYVLFGEPDAAGARPALEAVAERIAWWAELFEIPCAGYSGSIAEAETLAQAGADFVLVEDCIWDDPRGAAAALMDAAQAIRHTSTDRAAPAIEMTPE